VLSEPPLDKRIVFQRCQEYFDKLLIKLDIRHPVELSNETRVKLFLLLLLLCEIIFATKTALDICGICP